ncbi:OB-fold putative lipoprotein [Edwardsiella tarda]|uniref:OB-fold putative lipoprotein n=1 Tax=Edwardsiella tarda TaxID=636 RepID=UPI001EF9EEED|nr:OB-fold putative lipoprotein [Edwardsiella tarda]
MIKMIKPIIISLTFCSFMSIAAGSAPSNIQPYRSYLSNYVEMLATSSCEQTLKGGSKDEIIGRAADGMKKNTDTYDIIYNTATLGAMFGNKLKKEHRFFTEDKTEIDSCHDAAKFMMDTGFVKELVNQMTAETKPVVPTPKASISSDNVYRTTAKSLAELYNANEVAADDKIGGRSVEITGVVQDINKDFANNVVVQLQSGNRLLPVRLYMNESEKMKASELRKGQKTTVTCEKMVMIIGAPSGSNCTFN